MNNMQYIVKDNTRYAMHVAVELCEQGDFDSVTDAFKWLMQERDDSELGSGTCEMEYIDTYEYPDGDEDYLCKCSKCGRKSWEPAHNLPKFCGGCGKAVDK